MNGTSTDQDSATSSGASFGGLGACTHEKNWSEEGHRGKDEMEGFKREGRSVSR